MKIIDVPQTGKLGLTVTYPSRSGLIRRSWVVPTNPQTSSQIVQRSNLSACARGYDALTEAQQDAWITAAAKIRSRPTLGQSGPLSGLQLFVKINAALMAVGNAMVSTPPLRPTDDTLPITGLVITNTTGTIALKLSTTDSPPDGTMLWGCAPESSGVRRVVSPRFLGTLDSPANNAITITTLYTAKFGAPAPGQRVFVQCQTNINGWEGLRRSFSALVPIAA